MDETLQKCLALRALYEISGALSYLRKIHHTTGEQDQLLDEMRELLTRLEIGIIEVSCKTCIGCDNPKETALCTRWQPHYHKVGIR